MPDLEALIRKLEMATKEPPGINLDIALAEWRDVLVFWVNDETGQNEPYTYWRYSSSFRDALELARVVMADLGSPLWTIQSDFRYDTRDTFAKVQITIPSYEFEGRALGEHAEARALCAAICRASLYHPNASLKARAAR